MARKDFRSFKYRDAGGFEWVVFVDPSALKALPGDNTDVWAKAPKGSPYAAGADGNNIVFFDGNQTDNAMRSAIDQYVAEHRPSGNWFWLILAGWFLSRGGKRGAR